MISERALKDAVVELAKCQGWFVYHALPAINSRGRWATHFQGHAGFPDLVLVHPAGDMVVVELKSEIGKQTAAQRRWLMAFAAAGVEIDVWRPEQLKDGTIATRLTRPIKRG